MKRIAILFTFLCAGALNGMENSTYEYFPLGNLPIEAKAAVISSLKNYGYLNDIIKTIKILCLTNKEFNTIINELYGVKNQKGFTALVHMLANKFNAFTKDIATQFNIPASKKYKKLVFELQKAIMANNIGDIDKVINIINLGADINCTADYNGLLRYAIERATVTQNTQIIKLLLDAGANPNSKSRIDTVMADEFGSVKTVLDGLEIMIKWAKPEELDTLKQIKQMLQISNEKITK